MLIIPAVDLKDGKCVRLTEGRAGTEEVFSDDPLEMALRWQNEGAEYLHVVDLDGAFEGEPRNIAIAEAICRELSIPVELGGGLRTTEAVRKCIDFGVDRVVIGTRALESPEWLEELCTTFPGRIAAGIDARDGRVATKGWTDIQDISAIELAKRLDTIGVSAMIFTDIARDGVLRGANLDAVKEFTSSVSTPVIASGGVSTLDDVSALAQLPIAGMIVGKAIYAGRIHLPEAIALCQKQR